MSSDFVVVKKPGVLIKIPRKLGNTNKVPIKYQVFLFPAGQFILSEATPTMGVVIPSEICPERSADAVAEGLSSTTYNR